MKAFIVLLGVISLVYGKTLAHPKHFTQRCANLWDEGCINGPSGGAGGDDWYLSGNGFNPGKRCVNMWDEGCINGPLGGAGGDDYYLGGSGGGFNPGKRSLHELLLKLQNNQHAPNQ